MKIHSGEYIYDSKFQHSQIEITGKCNMRCEHCRAWDEAKVHMSFELFKKSIDFALSEADPDFRLTISGGEPFLHPQLVDFIKYAFSKGIKDIIITTNGFLVTKENLNKLNDLKIPNLAIQISIDSVNPQIHNKFRNTEGAFERAMESFDLLKNMKDIKSSLRATLTPDTMNEVRDLIKLAISKGATRIGIGTVIPAGRGKENQKLLFTPEQKKNFLEHLTECKKEFENIDVTTEDPLKFALEDCPWEYGEFELDDPALFGGCTAGITGFNVDSEGTITPCAVLLKPIVNIENKSLDEIKSAFENSEVIKTLYNRKFKGKCSNCKLIRLCGGCRAVAEGMTGDYTGSDVTCWR